jgi:peptidoglycan/xylan/chitin deacetylase (PgdA/CDA1 family)
MRTRFRQVWYKLTRPLTYFSSTRKLKLAHGAELICPVYHLCRPSAPIWWGDRYRIKPINELKRDLEELSKTGPFVSLDDLLEYRHRRKRRPTGYFLSFDDGYRELSTEIAPLLSKLGIPATFFVVSSIIDNRRPFHEDVAGAIQFELKHSTPAAVEKANQICLNEGKLIGEVLTQRTPDWTLLYQLCDVLNLDIANWLAEERPYLSHIELCSLSNSGFGIGAHSVDHPLFSEIDAKARISQIRESIKAVSGMLGKPCQAFAFPYGEFGLSRTSLDQLLTTNLADLYFGTRGITIDEFEPVLIQRILAEDHRGSFKQHLHRELRLQTYRTQMGRGTVTRREQ